MGLEIRRNLVCLCLCACACGASSQWLRGTVGQTAGPNGLKNETGTPRYGLVIFTAAIGAKYHVLAPDWCESISRHVTSALPFKSLPLVIADKDLKLSGPCATHVVSLSAPADDDGTQRLLQIKTLKMMHLPEQYNASVFMWLDIDVRPVATHAPWTRDLLSEIVASQASHEPYLGSGSIALTRTRRDVKYNGGLFLYSDRMCVNMWKQEIHDGQRANDTGRDQPALKTITKNATGCKVVDLPKRTQGYFTSRHAINAVLGRHDQAFDAAFMHFTGKSHDTKTWLNYLKEA